MTGINASSTASTHKTSWSRHWPALVGVGFAALVAFDLTAGADLAPVLAASAVVYIGAAALQNPRAAWPIFFVTVVIITVARLVDGRLNATWAFLGLGLGLLVYGLLTRAWQPPFGLPLQTVGLLVFGAAAAIALAISPDLGAYLVAAGLLGHTAWDTYHYRKKRVVVRSMAEFCMFLDAALAIAIVVLTLTS